MSAPLNSDIPPPAVNITLTTIHTYRDRFAEYLARLQRKIETTDIVASSGSIHDEPIEAFNVERQAADSGLAERLQKWLDTLRRVTDEPPVNITASEPITSQTAWALSSSDEPPVTLSEISRYLLHERDALEATINIRRDTYRKIKQDIRKGLTDEYMTKRAAWLDAIESVKPSFSAWNYMQDRLRETAHRVEEQHKSLHRHRDHISALTTSLRAYQASASNAQGINEIEAMASQLQIFSETWQLISATNAYIYLAKNHKDAAALLEQLEIKVAEAKDASKDFRDPVKEAVAAMDEIKERMKVAGMDVPGQDSQGYAKAKAEVEEEMEELKRQYKEDEKKSMKKTKRRDRSGTATAELITALSQLDAAVPGTEALWRLLEGTTAGRPIGKKPKKWWRQQLMGEGKSVGKKPQPPAEEQESWDKGDTGMTLLESLDPEVVKALDPELLKKLEQAYHAYTEEAITRLAPTESWSGTRLMDGPGW